MGLFGDFFQFFVSIMTGRKDRSKGFTESLAMGERYYRWGVERGDMRDQLAALEQLDKCRDDDCPRPDLLLRKYTCYLNSCGGLMEMMIKRHRETAESLNKSESDLVAEIQGIEHSIQKSRDRINTLKTEGSLIKAKEEEKHLDELGNKKGSLDRSLADRNGAPALHTSFDSLAGEMSRLCQGLESSMTMLEMNVVLPAEAVAKLREQFAARIEFARSALEDVAPID